MLIREELIKPEYRIEELNFLHCPRCIIGHLKVKEDSIQRFQSYDSRTLPPTALDKAGVFVGILQCIRVECREYVSFTGNYKTSYRITSKSTKVSNLYFNADIPIFDLDDYFESLSFETYDLLTKSFRLFWVDTNSCANKIRIAIEHFLSDLKIRKTQTKANGKRDAVSLHIRIERFGEKYPELKDHFRAIKFIGNKGSHSYNDIDEGDILYAYQILEDVFEKIYRRKQKNIQSNIKLLLKNKMK